MLAADGQRNHPIRSMTLALCLILLLVACQPVPAPDPAPLECDSVQALPPGSPEAQRIVTDFIDDFHAAFPTEYMEFYRLSAVNRYEDHVVLQGMLTEEQVDVLLIQKTSQGYRLLAHFIGTGALPSRQQVLNYFARELPPERLAILQCIDFYWLAGTGEEACL